MLRRRFLSAAVSESHLSPPRLRRRDVLPKAQSVAVGHDGGRTLWAQGEYSEVPLFSVEGMEEDLAWAVLI